LNKNGEVIGVLGIYSDITERKKMEQELKEQNKKIEKAYRSKGRFIAQASHEIRNPISSVSGSLSLIKERLDKLQIFIY
jgi:signal transduction histidine kinase